MMSEADAVARVIEAVVPGPAEAVPMAEADGRWMREDVIATVPLPGFDNSAMDGYAIAAADCGQTDRWLEVVGEIAAGALIEAPSPAPAPGRAVRIFTGAPVPPMSAAVVMQEETEAREGGCRIRITEAASPGEFIRRRGADVCEGQRLLAAGEHLTPARIGLLASQGRTSVTVGRRPAVLALSTGSELTAPGEPLPHAAAIYDSNGPLIASLARRHGAITSVSHVRDDLDALVAAIEGALATHEFVIITGGVSVGRHDHVKPALARLGWSPDLWRVAIRPGKPFLFSSRGGRHVFGLPGNPVSAFVTFHVLVAPALRKWQGASAARIPPVAVPAHLAEPLANPGDRPHYFRGRLDEAGRFHLSGLQESHALFALSRADVLARVPAATNWEAGRLVSVLTM